MSGNKRMSSPRLQVISRDEYKTWFEQHFCMLHRRSPFHQPAWLDAVGKGMQAEVVFVGLYEESSLVGALPGFRTRRGPFQLFGSPLRGTNTSYLGPIMLTPIYSNDDILLLIVACSEFIRRQWGVKYIEFTLREPPAESQQQLGPSWEQRSRGSYRLDLSQGEEALWSGMTYSGRRNIRKSQRLGVRIVPFNDAHMYYRMLDETFSRRGIIDWHPERFFQAVLEELVPQNLLWSWGVEYEGWIIAAGLFLRDDHEMHFLSGASLSQYRSIPTSYLLHWHAIVEAVHAGLCVYDLNGSSIPSINQFKESFGPEMTEYSSLIWAPGHVHYAKKVFLAALPYLGRFQRWRKNLI
jgi:Acetyltransferase (GNAT) domain